MAKTARKINTLAIRKLRYALGVSSSSSPRLPSKRSSSGSSKSVTLFNKVRMKEIIIFLPLGKFLLANRAKKISRQRN